MNTKEKGSFGEFIAAKYLENKGYKILETNYLSKNGEIDIIALNSNTIVFVEVRMRNNSSYYPEETINKNKIKKIIKTAFLFLQERNIKNMDVRFDVISIKDGEINHIENAFDMDFI